MVQIFLSDGAETSANDCPAGNCRDEDHCAWACMHAADKMKINIPFIKKFPVVFFIPMLSKKAKVNLKQENAFKIAATARITFISMCCNNVIIISCVCFTTELCGVFLHRGKGVFLLK